MRLMLVVTGIGWLLIAIAWATKGDWNEALDKGVKAGLSFGWAGAIRP